MTNTNISLTEFASHTKAKVISGLMVLAIFVSQTLYPYTALAVYDIDPTIATNSTYSNLVQANTTASTSLGTLLTAANTLTTMNTQFNSAQNGVLTLAMKQGLQGVNLTQITDASKILPEDSLTLAKVMVNEGVLAGALTTTQLKAGMTLGMESAQELVMSALRTASDGTLIYKGATYLVGNVDDPFREICQGSAMDGTLICSPGGDLMWEIIDDAVAKVMAYRGTFTLESGREVLSLYVFGMDPNATPVCDINGCTVPPVPDFMTDGSMDAALSTAIQNTIVEGLAGELVSYTGLLDQTAYKELFAEKMLEFTGLGNLNTLANSLTLPSFNQFQTTVTNAIHAEILNQVGQLSESLIGPASINNVVEGLIGNPEQLISNLTNDFIEDALGSGALSLTQLTSLAGVEMPDVQNIINGVIADTGLNVSSLDLNKILNGSLEGLTSFSGVADIADIKGIIAGEIAGVLPGINVNSLISQMGGDTIAGIEGTIKNVLTDNIISQMGNLTGVPSLSTIQSTLANSIISSTGIGDLSSITSALSGSMLGDTATNALNAALSSGSINLTQLTSLAGVEMSDVQNIINGVLSDTGLNVSGAQLNQILSGSLAEFGSFAGVADIADIKGIIGGEIANVLPGLDVNTLIGQMSGGTLAGIEGTIKNVLTENIIGDLSSFTGGLNISQIQSTIADSLLSSTGVGSLAGIAGSLGGIADLGGAITSLQSSIPVLSIATNAIEGAIASGAISLTQLTNLASVGSLDVQNILSGALSDTGLLNVISTDQFNSILSGSLEGFISFDKNIANVADIEKIIGTQIANVIPGLDVNTLMGQMGAGTLAGFQDTIVSVMEGNVMGQLSSLTGGLDVANVQSLLSNSILGTTGIGDFAGISNVIGGLPDLVGSLGNIEGTIQSVMSGQLGQLSSVLSSGNLEGIISGQLSGLSGLAGLSDVGSIMGAINPNISEAFSSITQIGGQLTSITGQFEGALGGLTLGLNSLTSSFNGQLGSLTNLSQLNLVGLSGEVSGLVGGLTSQITGPLSGAIGGLSGIASGITGTGLASFADLGGLAGSLGAFSGSLSGVLGGAGGIASLAGLGGMASVSGMMQMPFGGRIRRSIPCTCTPGFPFLVTLDANYAGGPNQYIFFPGRSVLFANYQIYRPGPYTVGLYSSALMGCAIYVFIGCAGVGGGPIITMVGTSR